MNQHWHADGSYLCIPSPRKRRYDAIECDTSDSGTQSKGYSSVDSPYSQTSSVHSTPNNDLLNQTLQDGQGEHQRPQVQANRPNRRSYQRKQLIGNSIDTCIGFFQLKNIQVRSDYTFNNEEGHVVLDICRNLVILRDSGSNKYAGMVEGMNAALIATLLATKKARLSATIQHPNYLRVLVYSSKSHGNELGDLLFDHACFLQEPETYDEATTYHNPQWLTRPSREPDTSHTEKASLTVRNHSLSSAEKDKVDELFQSAIGPATFKKVEVSKLLNTELKDHQLKALSMMFEKESGLLVDLEFPSLWTERQDLNSSTPVYINTVSKSKQTTRPSLCRGGLLADEMGLGKTLTILALVVSSLDRDNAQIVTSLRPTLIVAPLSTLPNWEDQIKMHLKFQSVRFMIYHGTSRRKNHVSLKDSDIVLTTYDTLRADYSGPFPGNNNKGKRRKINDGMLHNITWKRVVLDEAHIIKNRNSQIFHAACKLEAQHRWCVTVTPIQNSVEDLGALIGFLRISPFDTPSAFRKNILCPIGRRNSMFWGRLKHLVQCISLRRTKESIGASLALPQRREIEHPVDLTSDERRIYDLTKRHFNQALDSGKPSLCTFNLLLRLRPSTSVYGPLPPSGLTCEACNALIFDEELICGNIPCLHQICKSCFSLGNTSEGITLMCPLCKDSSPAPHNRAGSASVNAAFVGGRSSNYIPSSKVKALIQNLRCDDENQLRQGNPKPKSLVFSEWTSMLDLIGKALTRNGFTFQQLDGSLSLIQRRQTLFEFRNNPRCTVLLATLRCAGVGLDLTMASRVHLIEPGWNPMLERQALDRVHRLGQTKEVVSIRYIVQGSDSIEKYIRKVQALKTEMITSSLDSTNSDRTLIIEDILRDFRGAADRKA